MNKKEKKDLLENLMDYSNSTYSLLKRVEGSQRQRRIKKWLVSWWYYLTFRGRKNVR